MSTLLSRLSRVFSLSGETTGRGAWEIGPELGRGSVGIVYHVENKLTHLKAAMKIIDSHYQQLTPERWTILKERTYREAQILKLLDHPNIVKLQSTRAGGTLSWNLLQVVV